MSVSSLCVCVVASLGSLIPIQGDAKASKAPETFLAKAETKSGDLGVASVPLAVRIERYTPDPDLKRMEEALRTGGYPGFLAALRKSPVVGAVEVGNRKVPIRWARQTPEGEGRVISVVTDTPIFFLGGGGPDAKPKAGYEVAVLQLKMDSSGTGEGSIAAAARVKPGGTSGVQIDQYADQPIKLVSIKREIK